MKTKFINTLIVVFSTMLLYSFIEEEKKWHAPEAVNKLQNPVITTPENLITGKELYDAQCEMCHGEKGRGNGAKAASLEEPCADLTVEECYKQTDGALYWKITVGNDPMPSYRIDLTKEQRWLIINYIRTFEKQIEKHSGKQITGEVDHLGGGH